MILNCLLCQLSLRAVNGLCCACFRDLPMLRHQCTRCAAPLPEASGQKLCGNCIAGKNQSIKASLAPLRYQFPINYMITEFKFHGQLAFGRSLAQLLIQQIQSRQVSLSENQGVNNTLQLPQQIVAMPMHPSRQRERGFNQAHYIADQVSRTLCIKHNKNLCVRHSDKTPQSKLNKRARSQNMLNAFSVNCAEALPSSIAIVDDVITTGASVNALSKAFSEAGVTDIQVWALARTPL